MSSEVCAQEINNRCQARQRRESYECRACGLTPSHYHGWLMYSVYGGLPKRDEYIRTVRTGVLSSSNGMFSSDWFRKFVRRRTGEPVEATEEDMVVYHCLSRCWRIVGPNVDNRDDLVMRRTLLVALKIARRRFEEEMGEMKKDVRNYVDNICRS